VLLARFTAAGLADTSPATIIRERGEFYVRSDQVATNEFFEGAVGFAKVTELAAAAGAASIPGPITDAAWDGWYAWAAIQGEFSFLTAVGYGPNGGYRIVIDSKAMRKFERTESLVIMAENASATTGFTLAYKGRTLFKLH